MLFDSNKNIQYIFLLLLLFLTTSCTTVKVGEAPLTKSEIDNLQKADPKAFTVHYINDLEFDVTNTTFIEPMANTERFVQTYIEVSKYPIHNQRDEIANKTCQAKDLIATAKEPIGAFSRSYKCNTYIEESYRWIDSSIWKCSSFHMKESVVHPCSNVPSYPTNYCKKFSEIFEIYPGQVVSCQALSEIRNKALNKQIINSPIEYQSPQTIEKTFDLGDAEKKCSELGFKAKTEKFANCVIKLSR